MYKNVVDNNCNMNREEHLIVIQSPTAAAVIADINIRVIDLMEAGRS